MYVCMYLFWLHWSFAAARGLSLVVTSGGCSSCDVWASHCRGSSCCTAWAPGCTGFSGCPACGIFLDQGSNLCPLHWQVDSYALLHQGSPRMTFCDSLHMNNLLHRHFYMPRMDTVLVCHYSLHPSFSERSHPSGSVWAVSLLTLICLCPLVPEGKFGQ